MEAVRELELVGSMKSSNCGEPPGAMVPCDAESAIDVFADVPMLVAALMFGASILDVAGAMPTRPGMEMRGVMERKRSLSSEILGWIEIESPALSAIACASGN